MGRRPRSLPPPGTCVKQTAGTNVAPTLHDGAYRHRLFRQATRSSRYTTSLRGIERSRRSLVMKTVAPLPRALASWTASSSPIPECLGRWLEGGGITDSGGTRQDLDESDGRQHGLRLAGIDGVDDPRRHISDRADRLQEFLGCVHGSPTACLVPCCSEQQIWGKRGHKGWIATGWAVFSLVSRSTEA